MKSCKFDSLRKHLGKLADDGVFVALKTGTEAEDMSFEDIRIMRALSRDIVPLVVKIGGPEARNDIRELVDIGVDGLIAPMIESPYALKKFIQTLHEITAPLHFERLHKAINIETALGVELLGAILALDEAKELNQVTAARSDLSGSLDLDVDDPTVTASCRAIVDQARQVGCVTSVGGGIHGTNARAILDEIGPDRINTRNVVLDGDKLRKNPEEGVCQALAFEAEFYAYLSTMPGIRQKCYENRLEMIQTRIKKSVAVPAVS